MASSKGDISGSTVTNTSVAGTYYDGKQSLGQDCQLRLDDSGQLHFEGVDCPGLALAEAKISSRLGNTPRRIDLPNGGQFKTPDNDGIDRLLAQARGEAAGFSLHRWESSLRYLVVFAALFVVLAAGFFRYGLPWGSEKIAMALPAKTGELLAEGAMQQMDRFFSKTRLDAEQQQHYQQLFESLLPPAAEFNYRLNFRRSPYIGANALALPDGNIIMTDELIALAEHDQEVAAILLHEIAHVEHRHGLRSTVESIGIAALLSWMTGDLEAVSSLIITVPAILMQAKYSRNHESEADDYALQQMLDKNIDPIYFADIMAKLTLLHETEEEEQKEDKEHKGQEHQEKTAGKAGDKAKDSEGDDHKPKHQDGDTDTLLDYLSTHPASKKRVEKFKKASREFRKRGKNTGLN